jgi:membrane protease YdiL (CAAX protease family)
VAFVRHLLVAVVLGVRAERARLSVTTKPAVSRRAALVCGVMLVLWGNGLVLLSRFAGDDHREFVTLVGQVAAFTLAAVLLVRLGGVSRAELGWTPSRVRGGAALVLTLEAAAVVLALVAIAIRRDHCAAEGGVAVTVLRLLVATALGEEVLFRGVLFALWSRTTSSDRDVVIANTVLFVLWHVAGTFKERAFNPVELIGPAVGAPWFLWARCRFSWIPAAAIAHATTNVPTWLVVECF